MPKAKQILALSIVDLDFDLAVVQASKAAALGQSEEHYTQRTMPHRIECRNPDCRQGGIDLVMFVHFAATGVTEFECQCGGQDIAAPSCEACKTVFKLTLDKRDG